MTRIFHVFVAGGLFLAAVTAPGCSEGIPHTETDTAGSLSLKDTLNTTLCFTAPGGVRILDLLIYSDTLTKDLISHIRKEKPSKHLKAAIPGRGDGILVAIANSPAPLRVEALQRFDSAERLEMLYRDEDPGFPLMSAVLSIPRHPPLDTVTVRLTPLLCRVELACINNRSGSPLTDAEIRLRNVNARAQVLRSDGFHIAESESLPEALAHPEMMLYEYAGTIGEEPCLPGVSLYCYPFEREGPSDTELVFCATADGTRREWVFPLPPMQRNGSAEMLLSL
ncbi:MAG: hypothetical protein K6F58_05170 [Bacteroidales bacterium]|nr:hypothetical protein [Bacteroidales bacterium]